MEKVSKSQPCIPQLQPFDEVLTIYYSKSTIGNSELDLIFKSNKKGCSLSLRKKSELKKIVNAKLIENGGMLLGGSTVPTRLAFEVWGINIEEIEENFLKLKKLEKLLK